MKVFLLFFKSTLPKSVIILFALYTVADFCPPKLGRPIKAFTHLSPITLLFFYGTAAWHFYEQNRQAEEAASKLIQLDDAEIPGTPRDGTINRTEGQLSRFEQSLGQAPPVIDIQREPEVFTPIQHQPPVRSRPQNLVPADAGEPRENVISFPSDPWEVESDRSELDQILSEFRTRKSS